MAVQASTARGMLMERLDIRAAQPNTAIEAAVHFARYAIAVSRCPGKRVLDVSCGEGYGSKLLRSAGAFSVDGVDNAEAAIVRARDEFGGEGLTFHCLDAEMLDELFPPGTFDLIVSLETVEHVPNPIRFLRAIKRVARHDATIIVSCPNDHWYYPSDDTSNPYHVKKYTFEEYRTMTSEALGTNVQWLLGTAMLGFGTVPIDGQQRTPWQALSQGSWLKYRRQGSAFAVPGLADDPIGPWNCSYFVGIWGEGAANAELSSVAFPMSMDRYRSCASALLGSSDSAAEAAARERRMNEAIAGQQDELRRVRARLSQAEQEGYKFHLQAAALTLESDIMGASVKDLVTERDRLLQERDQLVVEKDRLVVEADRLVVEADRLRVPAERYLWLASRMGWAAPRRARPLLRRMVRRFFS